MRERLTSNLQNSIIFLSVVDSDFIKMVAGQISPEFFSSAEARKVFEICISYFKRLKRAPENHLHDEIVKETYGVDEEEKVLLAKYALRISKANPPDKDYVIARLSQFIRERTLTNATFDFAKLVEAGQYDKATNLMNKALKSGIEKMDSGLRMLDDHTNVGKRENAPRYLTDIGIPDIDRVVGGISAGELVLLIGAYKGYKSLFGHHIAYTALLNGLNVLHVSHENSLQEVENRYDMMFGMLLNDSKPATMSIKYMQNGIIKRKRVVCRTIYDKKTVIRGRRRVKSFGGELVIKKFPMGSCSTDGLDSYIKYLINYEGFKPDVVINDYVDIMRMVDTKKPIRDSLNEAYIALKGMADEGDFIMVTMSQVNREGLVFASHRGKLEGIHVAEDIRKIGNIDKGYFVVRTPDLERTHEMYVGCFANRNKGQDVNCIVGVMPAIGQFCMYSYPVRDENA